MYPCGRNTVMLWVVTILAATVAARGETATARRWAIVSSGDVKATEVPDVLTTQLGGVNGMELVERDQIETATRELVLTELAGSEGVANRSRLGRALKADVLVILAIETAAAQPPSEKMLGMEAQPASRPPTTQPAGEVIQMTVCDCASGARLARIAMAFDRAEPEAAVAQLRQAIVDTHSQFPQGVRAVVGIPPFVSHNLTYEYDFLQTVFAEALATVVSATPGVAVVELQEAHAIRREAELSQGSMLSRRVPAFIEGEYRVAVTDGKPTVRMTVRVTTGEGAPRQIDQECPSPAEAVAFLTAQGPSWLAIDGGAARPALSRDRELELMRARIESFSRVGAVEQSVGLREALLLLDPTDWEQRRGLAHDYDDWLPRFNSPSVKIEPKGQESMAVARCRRTIDMASRALEHLEALIINRQIGGRYAVILCERIVSCLSNSHGVAPDSAARELFEPAEALKARFLKSVYPRILALEGNEPDSVPADYSEWQGTLIKCAAMRYDRTWGDPNAYEPTLLFDVIENVMPDKGVPDLGLWNLIVFARLRSQSHGMMPSEPDLRLFRKLAQSQRRANAFYGKVGVLLIELDKDSRSDARLRQAVEELRRLECDCPEAFQLTGSCAVPDLCRILDVLEAKAFGYSVPPPPSTWPAAWSAPPYRNLTFERVPINIRIASDIQKTMDTDPERKYAWDSQLLRIVPCGKQCDIAWRPATLFIHREPGVFAAIAYDATAEFSDATWDGKNIWVATCRQGVWVLNDRGDIILRIGKEQGLPPADRGLCLCAMSEGTVMACGAFKPHDRAWCAVIRMTEASGQVQVFHEATRTHLRDDPQEIRQATDRTFVPSWIGQMKDYPRKGESRILIGRHDYQMIPLEIDPSTLRVSTVPNFPVKIGTEEYRCYSLGNGELLGAAEHGLLHLAAPGSLLSNGKPYDWMCRNGYAQGELFMEGGRFLYPGKGFWCLDPKTMHAEVIDPTSYSRSWAWGTSAHFGLIEYPRGRGTFLFRVRVELPGSPSFVPVSQASQ
jgi:hypothetical protein